MEKKPFELEVVSVRLVKEAPMLSSRRIQSPLDAVEILGELLCELDREVLCVVNINTAKNPINCHFASMGALSQAIANPREIFKAAILSNAASMILMHNHPSGSLNPSAEDTRITDCIQQIGALMGIPLLDHIIVGARNDREYFSFHEKGLIKSSVHQLQSDYKELSFESNCFAAEEGRGR